MAALPKAVNISQYAFYNCSSLTSVSLPSAAIIGSSAFNRCYELYAIDLPQASIIYSYAFSDCRNLTSISIPKIQAIKGNAFANCYNLSQIILPDTLTELGIGTFDGCSNLSSITIPSTITKLGANCFSSCINLSNITFNGNISSIGECCFANCAFSSIFMPYLTVLGNSAFCSCRSLTKAVFGKLSSCGYGVFGACENLEELHLIEFNEQNTHYLFTDNQIKLSAIYVYGEKVPAACLNPNLRERISSCKLYVRNSMLPYYNLDDS